jgi:hypothetical protein
MMSLEKRVAQHSVVCVEHATYMYIAFLTTYCEVYDSRSLARIPARRTCMSLSALMTQTQAKHRSDPLTSQLV